MYFLRLKLLKYPNLKEKKNMKKKICTIITFTLIIFFMLAFEVLEYLTTSKNYSPKEKANIHLYGESHGEPQFYQKELEAWGKFYSKGYRALFVELPYYSAEFLNLWLQADDDAILNQFYDDIDGTLTHVEEYLDFLHTIKNNYPQTIFYGTDVGHQYDLTGKRYLEYLESVGLKDSEQYKLTETCIEQGKNFYITYKGDINDSYREQMMVQNFIDAYDRLGQKEIMGIYGSDHTNMKVKERMAAQLNTHYGDVVECISIYNLIMNHHFDFGFGYVGLIFLLMLFIPNIVWTKFKPLGYENYVQNENKVLGVFEKIGEVGATVLLLFFKDCNFRFYQGKTDLIVSFLDFEIILVFVLMIFYEIYWIRYFRSARTMKDFYRGIAGIPLAGAVIPVLSLFILGIYSRNIAIIVVSVFLGIGHIGIHYGHYTAKDWSTCEAVHWSERSE